jgi:hypothetical protein
MPRRLACAVLLLACCSLGACAARATGGHTIYVSPDVRLATLRRAQVWHATDVAAMDIVAGPNDAGAFPPGATVTCTYLKKQMHGRSPKFACVVPPDDELKVRYGTSNGEVFATVAATRLFWALGFGAEHVYPVHVRCQGCPAQLTDTETASIERKVHDKDIESSDGSGWSWPELDLVDAGAGGAPRAQRDALKLLAVLLQHSDSKPEQQRLVCLSHQDGQEPCREPFLMVHDLGNTFGRANAWNRNPISSVNFDEWRGTRVWKDRAKCIAGMTESYSGTLGDPKISEAGRRFLADLLVQLTDAQLHDLFTVARFPERRSVATGGKQVDDWVAVFKQKRDDVVNNVCQP